VRVVDRLATDASARDRHGPKQQRMLTLTNGLTLLRLASLAAPMRFVTLSGARSTPATTACGNGCSRVPSSYCLITTTYRERARVSRLRGRRYIDCGACLASHRTAACCSQTSALAQRLALHNGPPPAGCQPCSAPVTTSSLHLSERTHLAAREAALQHHGDLSWLVDLRHVED
jgi:hypothetical protein